MQSWQDQMPFNFCWIWMNLEDWIWLQLFHVEYGMLEILFVANKTVVEVKSEVDRVVAMFQGWERVHSRFAHQREERSGNINVHKHWSPPQRWLIKINYDASDDEVNNCTHVAFIARNHARDCLAWGQADRHWWILIGRKIRNKNKLFMGSWKHPWNRNDRRSF